MGRKKRSRSCCEHTTRRMTFFFRLRVCAAPRLPLPGDQARLVLGRLRSFDAEFGNWDIGWQGGGRLRSRAGSSSTRIVRLQPFQPKASKRESQPPKLRDYRLHPAPRVDYLLLDSERPCDVRRLELRGLRCQWRPARQRLPTNCIVLLYSCCGQSTKCVAVSWLSLGGRRRGGSDGTHVAAGYRTAGTDQGGRGCTTASHGSSRSSHCTATSA